VIYDGSVLIKEILEYKKKLWEENRFCQCGADSLRSCSCNSEKKNRFLRRRKKKTNEKFEEELDEAFVLMAQSEEVRS